MTQDRQASLEEVLDMLLDEFGSPNPQAVARYSSQFPHFRDDILRFAALWAEEEHLPPAPALTNSQEEQVALRAQSFFQNVLHTRGRTETPVVAEAAAAPAALRTLAQLAEAEKLSVPNVARALGLPMPLMSKLNGRRYRPETIPARLVARLAEYLHTSAETILAACAPGAAATAPAFMVMRSVPLPSALDFRADVEAAADLSASEKALLLAEA